MDLFYELARHQGSEEQSPICHLLFPNNYPHKQNRPNSLQVRSTHRSHTPKLGIKLTQPSKFLLQPPETIHNTASNQTGTPSNLRISKIKQKIKNSIEKGHILCTAPIQKQANSSFLKYQMPAINFPHLTKPQNIPTRKKLQQKFNWKAIPQNTLIKNQYKMERKTISNTLQLPKNFEQTYATYAQTNGMRSIENSKNNNDVNVEQYVKQPEWLSKMQSQDSLIHSRQLQSSSKAQNSVIVDSNVSNVYDFHDIDQIQTVMTHSRVSEPSPDMSKNIVLDESFVEWTYQTGFRTKTQPNQPYEQQF